MTLKLTDDEKAMLDGQRGKACQKAMELLVRYAEALGAERFVDTNNVAGVPGTSNPFLEKYFTDPGDRYDVIFSRFDLDSDEVVEIPRMNIQHACHLQGGVDPENWETLGAKPEQLRISQAGEAGAAAHNIRILKTCTPYIAGLVPRFGEHCAWMESSAVVYCNSVLGARTNTEGRESTSAAMLTGKIPDFGFHRDEYRFGSHLIQVEVPVESVMDWGMLGYFIGECVGERIPVITGRFRTPDLIRHKHFGAAAASSGGVEMYHMVGVTPEAPTPEAAFGPKKPVEVIKYGEAERRRTYENLNARGSDPNVDYVMLGCPHAALEQIQEICQLLEGKRISPNVRLWIFTSRAVRAVADQQ
ncbi:MAG TPA: aconitase X, partial [Steroidobacteraceae bacterium]